MSTSANLLITEAQRSSTAVVIDGQKEIHGGQGCGINLLAQTACLLPAFGVVAENKARKLKAS